MGVLAAPPDILRYRVIKVKHLPFHPLTARIHIRIEYDGYTVRRVYTNSSGKGAGDLGRGKYVNRSCANWRGEKAYGSVHSNT